MKYVIISARRESRPTSRWELPTTKISAEADGRWFIALLWLVPDRRIERVLVKREGK
jgi:hypothetical protein